MAEPIAPTVATGTAIVWLVAWFGPAAPELALILFGATVGVMHPLSRKVFTHWADAFAYLGMWTLTGCLLTGIVTWLLKTHFGVPADRWPGVVAWSITFFSERWPGWFNALADMTVGRLLGRTIKPNAASAFGALDKDRKP